MNPHKGIVAPLLLILVAILLVGGGAYVFTKNKQLEPTVTTQATSTVQNTPGTRAADSQTANWKTYRNEKYGFSFQYPPDFVIAAQDHDNVIVSLLLANGNKNADAIDGIDVIKNISATYCSPNSSDNGWETGMGGYIKTVCFMPQHTAITVWSSTTAFTKSDGDRTLSSFRFIP